MITIDWDNLDNILNNKITTPAERISIALHPDIPLIKLKDFAKYDVEVKVIEAAGLNKKATKEIIDIVTTRLKCSEAEFQEKRDRYTEEVNKKILANFCPIPWNHVSTNPDGTLRICCQHVFHDIEPSRGKLTNTEGNRLTHADDLDKNRNAPEWKQIRKEFINGLRPDVCKLCWDEEKNGIGSRREWVSKTYFDDHDEFITKVKWETEEDGTINPEQFPVEYWDLRFGNKCNLKCRTCGPTDSDQWYDDYLQLVGDTYNSASGMPIKIEIDEHGKGYVDKVFDWYKDSKLWDYIIDNIDKINRIYFTGGEPTINSKHKELLDILISKNLAPNVCLDYNSNVANVPTAIFGQWQHFKEVQIGMSVDGIFEHFEYIRHQGKWKSAERAMRRIDTDPKLKNVKASVAFTLSILNVLHFADMQWWMKEQNWNRIQEDIIIHNLYGPDYLNIQNLPGEIKHYIKKYYEEFLHAVGARWYDDLRYETGPKRKFWYHTKKKCDTIIHHMYDKEPDSKAWENFEPETSRIDTLRGEDWKKSLPEIAELIQQYNDKAKRKQSVKLQ